MWTHDKPILKIEIFEAANLELLEPDIKPIFIFSSDNEEVKSKPGIKENSLFKWNEKLSLSLNPKSEISLDLCSLSNQKLVTLRTIFIPFEGLSESSKPIDKWIDLKDDRQTSLSFSVTGILASGLMRTAGKSPQVHVLFTFDHNNYLRIESAEVQSYKILLKNKEVYTIYLAQIMRNDGKNWIKNFRFSEVYEFKQNLEKVELGLSNVYLPGKTYFEFLACVWPELSRFDLKNIEKRKKGIQDFLSFVIEKQKNLETELLNRIFN